MMNRNQASENTLLTLEYRTQVNLKSQEEFLRQYANGKGVILDEFISDIGSGRNYKRKKWNALLDEVMRGEVEAIYITFKDRFVRGWFEQFCSKFNTKLIVFLRSRLISATGVSRRFDFDYPCIQLSYLRLEEV